MTTMRIGIDLGGTKIEGIALAADNGVCAQRRVATPAGDYDATVAAIVEAVQLQRLHQRGDVLLGRRDLRVVGAAHHARDDQRGQHAEDRDDDHDLDQREAARQPGADAAGGTRGTNGVHRSHLTTVRNGRRHEDARRTP